MDIPINTQEVRTQQPTYFTACLLLAYINYYIAIQYCRSLFDNLSIVDNVLFIGQHSFLSFLPFSLFFTISVADIRVVGLFAVSQRVNKLSTWMSVTRSNDSAQGRLLKKMICSQGTSICVSIVTFCDDNGYSWLSCSYLLNWTYFFLQQPSKRICVPLAVNCGQIVLIALL